MFRNWSYNQEHSSYQAVREIVPKLPAGMYTLGASVFGDPIACKLDLRQDEMFSFANGPLRTVLLEIDRFFAARDRYTELGVSHKRSILLYGPPGCGKTGIMQVAIEQAIASDGLVFRLDRGVDIDEFSDRLKLVRQVESIRRTTVVIEDLDSLCDHWEETLLELLDGSTSTGENLMFLSTTNDLTKIPKRIRCRPSRVDTLIEIGFPNAPQREEYLELLLRGSIDNIAEIVELTHNFSLAMLKELVLSIRIFGNDLKSSIATIRELSDPDE